MSQSYLLHVARQGSILQASLWHHSNVQRPQNFRLHLHLHFLLEFPPLLDAEIDQTLKQIFYSSSKYLIQELCDIIDLIMDHGPYGLVLPLTLVVQGNVHQPEYLNLGVGSHLVFLFLDVQMTNFHASYCCCCYYLVAER